MKSYYIQSNSVKLHLLADDEDKLKDTILFVHGYPDDHITWSNQFEYFSKKYRVAALDLRGIPNDFQKSSPENFTIEELMADIDAAVHFLLSENQKLHLVGHDWGAVISWCYISDVRYNKNIFTFTAISCPHPRLMYDNIISRLISFSPKEIIESLNQIIKSWYILLFQIPIVPEFLWNLFAEEMWKLLLKNSGLNENDPMFQFSKDKILRIVLGNINLYRAALAGINLPELPMEKVNTPILLIIPEKDLVLDTIVYDKTSEYYSKVDFEYLKANHWVHREKASLVNERIEKFYNTYIKNSDIKYHFEWDARELNSGEILSELKNKISKMNSGNILKLIANQRELKSSLQTWSHITGNSLLKFTDTEYYIKKK